MKRISRWFAVIALVGALGFAGVPVHAQTFSVLYSFTGGSDGGHPLAGLIQDSQGALYGATISGGDLNVYGGIGAGVVFKLDAEDNESVLYSFTGGSDGGYPQGGLFQDAQGNLYGTTAYGGDVTANSPGFGVAFKLDATGNESVLHSFTGGSDGNQPLATLTPDASGNLYGTAYWGGNTNSIFPYGAGVVWETDSSGAECLLYAFTGGADGGGPRASLVRDSQGNLYGMTTYGGEVSSNWPAGAGVVFKLDDFGNESVIYTFTGGSDGAIPVGPLFRDKHGNIYGMTSAGGAAVQNMFGGVGLGVIFKIDASGVFRVLHTFTGGSDGSLPQDGFVADTQGNLYGTAFYGGAFGAGVVFRLDAKGNFSVLYAFRGGSDGADPYSGLTQDSYGNLYGTTYSQGAHGYGVVYELSFARLSGLHISPHVVKGGHAATGTITLTVPAPVGGAIVSLSSTNSLVVQVPSNVTVPAGAKKATFAVTTSSVQAKTQVAIVASFSSAMRSAVLTVKP